MADHFVDSHAHLADEAFRGDRDEVIARARAAGAVGIVCIGESIPAAREARAIAAAYPGFIAFTAGVHPHDASTFDRTESLAAIRELVEHGASAIGECGLDYHYDNSPPEVQRTAFAAQLELSTELGRPVVVHTRDAEEDTIAMISEYASTGARGVLHCFTGTPVLAEAALSCGWFISFSGIVTFKKWDRDDVVRAVPSDRLLVESDSPYLAPIPNRGKRNEPAWVAHTLAHIARVRDEPVEQVARQTSANARTLFGLAAVARST
jgi:TatD DNase family protein